MRLHYIAALLLTTFAALVAAVTITYFGISASIAEQILLLAVMVFATTLVLVELLNSSRYHEHLVNRWHRTLERHTWLVILGHLCVCWALVSTGSGLLGRYTAAWFWSPVVAWVLTLFVDDSPTHRKKKEVFRVIWLTLALYMPSLPIVWNRCLPVTGEWTYLIRQRLGDEFGSIINAVSMSFGKPNPGFHGQHVFIAAVVTLIAVIAACTEYSDFMMEVNKRRDHEDWRRRNLAR